MTQLKKCNIQIVWKYSRVSFYDDSHIHFYDPLDRALPTCGASMLQLKHPFYTECASSSFWCSFLFYFSAVLLSWLWFFHPWRPSKRQKKRKYQNSWRYVLSWCLLNHGLGLLQQNKKWFDWYFFQLSV
jgi:hypothetical protein